MSDEVKIQLLEERLISNNERIKAIRTKMKNLNSEFYRRFPSLKVNTDNGYKLLKLELYDLGRENDSIELEIIETRALIDSKKSVLHEGEDIDFGLEVYDYES